MTVMYRARFLWRTATGNWMSRAYLAIAAALLVWAWVDAAYIAQPDSSFVIVYPLLFTAPVSVLALLAHVGSLVPLSVLIVVSALVNATLIGLGVRMRTARAGRTAHGEPGSQASRSLDCRREMNPQLPEDIA